MVCGFVCVVLPCFSWVLPPLKLFNWLAKPSVMFMVLHSKQRIPVNSMVRVGGSSLISEALVWGLWVRL